MFLDCIRNTSAHGLPHIFKKETYCSLKIVWIVIFGVASGLFLFHSSSMIDKYLQHSTSISVALDLVEFLPPDVYVCNNYPYSLASIDQLIINYNNNNNKQDKDIIRLLTSNNNSHLHLTSLLFNRQLPPAYSRESLFPLMSDRNYSDLFVFRYANELMINARDMFDLVPHYYHESCYKLRDRYKSMLLNEGHFELLVFTDRYSFAPPNTNPLDHAMRDFFGRTEASHTVYTVPPSQYPHVQSERVQLHPARKTVVELSMQIYDRINSKNFSCLSDRAFINYRNPINSSTSETFEANLMDCQYKQLIKEFIRICNNCTLGIIPQTNQEKIINLCPIDQLLLNQNADSFCLNTRHHNIDKYYRECQDQDVCKRFIYTLQSNVFDITDEQKEVNFGIILGQLLNQYKTPPIYGDYAAWIKSKSDGDVLPEKFKNSLAQISIFAHHPRATVWIESDSYELKDLLSDIGGILGFYVGVSVVTSLEIVAYVFKFIRGRRDVQKRVDLMMTTKEEENNNSSCSQTDNKNSDPKMISVTIVTDDNDMLESTKV